MKGGEFLKNKIITSIILVLSICFLMCGRLTYAVSNTSLNKQNLTMTVKDTYTLKVKGSASNTKWSSSNKKVATVNASGKVTAKKSGKAVITATVNGSVFKCKVTVKNKATISKKTLTLGVGAKKTLTLKNTTSKPKWKSSNTLVAKVSSKGVVTGKKTGTAKIKAMLHGKTYTCTVKVMNKKKKVLTTSFKWTGKDYDGTLKDLEFTVTGQLDDGSTVNYYYNSGSGNFYTSNGDLAMVVTKKVYSDYAIVTMEFHQTDGYYQFEISDGMNNGMTSSGIVASVHMPGSSSVKKYTTDTGMYRSYTSVWYWSPFIIDHGKLVANE